MAIFASFARYIFRTFTFKATIIILYYVAPLWLFIDTETDYLEWSFCVKKSSPSSASNGLAFWLSEKLLGNLQSYALSSAKNVAQRLYWWYKRYGVIHWRYPKRKHQTSQLQTCNKSSNSQVQVHCPQVQVQVHVKWASPSPSPSPLQKSQVQVQVHSPQVQVQVQYEKNEPASIFILYQY